MYCKSGVFNEYSNIYNVTTKKTLNVPTPTHTLKVIKLTIIILLLKINLAYL